MRPARRSTGSELRRKRGYSSSSTSSFSVLRKSIWVRNASCNNSETRVSKSTHDLLEPTKSRLMSS